MGALSFKFDNTTLQESYSSFQISSPQAQTNYNGSITLVIQPFPKSAVQMSALKGGNFLGKSWKREFPA